MDADDFHSKANIRKMSRGIALDDDDRLPWLDAINLAIQNHRGPYPLVLACSALKASYRERLQLNQCPVVLLTGPQDILRARLASRATHFFPSQLLESQLEILEIPSNAIILEINQTPDKIIEQIVLALE